MKKLVMMMAGLLLVSVACASGVYTIASRVTLTGPASLGVLQPNTPIGTVYGVAAPTPLASVVLSGDPQFSAATSACVGLTSCVLPIQFTAPVGGDYVTTVTGYSSHVGRFTATHSSKSLAAHVVGANYSLVPDAAYVAGANSDTPIPVRFTLTATGETPLVLSAIVAGDYLNAAGLWNSGRVTVGSDCPPVLGVGVACKITASYSPAGLESDSGYYAALVAVQVSGNTRQQPAQLANVGVTL